MRINRLLFTVLVTGTMLSGILTNDKAFSGSPLGTTSSSEFDSKIIIAAEDNLYFGEGYYANRQDFHLKIKKRILANSGAFQKKVGSNPDIAVKDGKIILIGTGDFKGRSFPTDLLADGYFLKK